MPDEAARQARAVARAHLDERIEQRLGEHDGHLARINGSIDRFTVAMSVLGENVAVLSATLRAQHEVTLERDRQAAERERTRSYGLTKLQARVGMGTFGLALLIEISRLFGFGH